MTLTQHVVFIACVAVAGYVQNLTGFALGLVLLGLVGLTQAAPLAGVTNVISVLTLVNAIGLFRASRPQLERAVVAPALGGSLLGVAAGVVLLAWLSGQVVVWLQLLLGVAILGCALVLVSEAAQRPTRSSPASFAGVGLLAGVLGGLFSTAGPPLVYHFYRQPMSQRAVRDALVTIFAVNAVLRLVLMAVAGRLGPELLWLSLEAVPMLFLQAYWMGRRPPRWSGTAVRRVVCALLMAVAAALIVQALHRLI